MKSLDKKEMEEMNRLAKRKYSELTEFEQRQLINLIYPNVRRFMHSVFNKIGRDLHHTLQFDKFDEMVQDVTYGLVDLLIKDKFNPKKAKFSTVLGTHVSNRVFKEGYLERMGKRKGVSVPLIVENDDGTVTEYLASEDDVEEQVIENMERQATIDRVQNAISKLKPREQIIIRMRMQEKKLSEISEKVGVSRERIRQILLNVMEDLKEELEKTVS